MSTVPVSYRKSWHVVRNGGLAPLVRIGVKSGLDDWYKLVLSCVVILSTSFSCPEGKRANIR